MIVAHSAISGQKTLRWHYGKRMWMCPTTKTDLSALLMRELGINPWSFKNIKIGPREGTPGSSPKEGEGAEYSELCNELEQGSGEQPLERLKTRNQDHESHHPQRTI